jgi:hypothetical protein
VTTIYSAPTIVFLTTDMLLSRIIRRITKSPASHVVLGLSLYGVPVLLQADVGGVQIIPRSKFLIKHRIVSEWEFTSPGIEYALAQGVREIGEGYDYIGLFGYLAVVVGKLFHRRIKNPLASRKAFVCSEFVVGLDRDGHCVPEWMGLDPEATMPSDLLAICNTSTSFRRIW